MGVEINFLENVSFRRKDYLQTPNASKAKVSSTKPNQLQKQRTFVFQLFYRKRKGNMAWKTSDAESLRSSDEQKRKKKIKLAIYVSIFVVFQIIVITTMSLTVMKVKTPRFRLGNINLQSFEAVPATPSFDTKFTAQIKIKNSANWGSYKFNAANVTFQYQGATVAVINIAKGKAGWLSTIKRNAEVTLSSSGITGSNLGSELSSGVLTLNSVGRLNGKVAIMFIMKKKKAANMNCTIALDRIKLAIYITIFVVFQIIVITAMSLTVMKVKTPRFRLGNINVESFVYDTAAPSFDTKFTTQIKIKNSANWGSYKFSAANVTFQHKGATLAVIDIAKGKAGWLSTIKRNAEVTLNSSAIDGSNFGSELSNGVLTLNSVGRLNGKVAIMFIMKKKKAANMNCTIAFDVAAKTLKSLQCK
ncbi:unnamed protein product [Prunus brigantina]